MAHMAVKRMPKSGDSIHFCKACEARGVETPVHPGQTLCPDCLAAQAAQAGPAGAEVSLDDPRLTEDEAREIMRMRTDENCLVQAAVCAFIGGLLAVIVVLRLNHPGRYSRPLLSGHALLVAMIVGWVAGAIGGGIWGYRRPPWKWAL